MANDVLLTDLPLELETVLAAVRHAGAGNISVFVDVVTPSDQNPTATQFEYEALRPLAMADMQRCVDELATAHHGARLAVGHRLGRVSLGDVVLVCAVSAPNRSDAITACSALVVAIKTRVAIGRRDIGGAPLPSIPAPLFSSEPPAPMTNQFSPLMTPSPYALDAAAIRNAAAAIRISAATGGPVPATKSITIDIEEHELEPLEGRKSPYPNTLPPAPIRLDLSEQPMRLAKRKRT